MGNNKNVWWYWYVCRNLYRSLAYDRQTDRIVQHIPRLRRTVKKLVWNQGMKISLARITWFSWL